jgi:transcriptional regulator with XRE-family HTH domain
MRERGPMEGQTIGQRIKYLRLNLGMEQEELAEAAGISARGLRKIESGGAAHPRGKTLRGLADALGVTVPQLTGADLEGAEDRIMAAIDELRAELGQLRRDGSE